MPDNLKEDEVQKWFREITLSLAWRKPKEDIWLRIIDYFKGKYFDALDEEDKICVNMVFPHVKVVIPTIYSRNPDVIVLPRRRDEYNDDLIRKRAEVMQNLLRYYLKELDIKTEVKLCILDAILTGNAWIKTGYDTEFEELRAEESEKETVISKFLRSLGLKERAEEESEKFASNEKIVSERPWALRTSPFDIIVPALSRRTEELRWIVERILYPYDEVMENSDYNTDGLKPSANANQLLASLRGAKYANIPMADEVKYSILYEVWDGREQKVYTLAEGHRKALQVKDSGYTFLDSRYHPYVSLRFNEIIDEFYPMSDVEPAEPQLLELNETRTQMNTHRKRYNRRYATKPGAFDPQAKADLKIGEDGTIVEVSPTYADQSFEQIIYPIADADLPAEIYTVENRVKDDIFTILGTSDYASRASGGARSATEASIIATQSRFKVEERIDIIGEFVGKVVRNIAQIAQKYMDSEQVGNVVGLDSIYWVQLSSRKEIQGEFSYNIVYGSTTPINREVENEQFMKFYALARNDPYYDQTKLRLQLVRKFNLENPESWLVTQIAQELERQRLVAVKKGLLLEGVINPPGTIGPPGQVPSRGEGERLPTGQPRGLGAARPAGAVVPGGRGGTALA